MDLKTQIHNEGVKLRAGLLNSIAATCLSAGSVTPLGLIAFGNAPTHLRLWFWAIGSVMLFAVGLGLHYRALRTLKGLRE